MDRAQRKAVHDMANRLRVISKSSGLVSTSLLSSKLLRRSYHISRDLPSVSHAFRIMECPPRLGVVRIIWERKGRKKRKSRWKVESRIVLVSGYLSHVHSPCSLSIREKDGLEWSHRLFILHLLPQGEKPCPILRPFPHLCIALPLLDKVSLIDRSVPLCFSRFLCPPLVLIVRIKRREMCERERWKGEIYGQAKGEWREGEGGNRKGRKRAGSREGGKERQ